MTPVPASRRSFDEQGRGLQLRVVATPPLPAPNRVELFAVLNTGTGKVQLKAQFPTGAAQVVATEP